MKQKMIVLSVSAMYLAIILQWTGIYFANRGAVASAEMTVLKANHAPAQRIEALTVNGNSYSRSSDILTFLGLLAALLGLVAYVRAKSKSERRPMLPISLLLVYLASLLLLV